MGRRKPGRLVKHTDGRTGIIYGGKEYEGLKTLKFLVHWVDPETFKKTAEPTLVSPGDLTVIGMVD